MPLEWIFPPPTTREINMADKFAQAAEAVKSELY